MAKSPYLDVKDKKWRNGFGYGLAVGAITGGVNVGGAPIKDSLGDGVYERESIDFGNIETQYMHSAEKDKITIGDAISLIGEYVSKFNLNFHKIDGFDCRGYKYFGYVSDCVNNTKCKLMLSCRGAGSGEAITEKNDFVTAEVLILSEEFDTYFLGWNTYITRESISGNNTYKLKLSYKDVSFLGGNAFYVGNGVGYALGDIGIVFGSLLYLGYNTTNDVKISVSTPCDSYNGGGTCMCVTKANCKYDWENWLVTLKNGQAELNLDNVSWISKGTANTWAKLTNKVTGQVYYVYHPIYNVCLLISKSEK